MPSPDVAVIVVSYNVRELMRACLESLYACASAEGLQADVMVIDNASSDASAEMVSISFPDAVLLQNEVNLGFAAATNQGLRHLGYPEAPAVTAPVLLLNPDTEVWPGAMRLMLEDLANLPHAGVIGPGLRYADGTLQHSAFRFPGLAQIALEFFPVHWRLTESSVNGRYCRQERGTEPFPCDHPLGAAMLLRPEAIRDVGLFDDDFFMYCEEVDWCWRAHNLGWQVWSDPRAVIVHHSARSTAQARSRMYVELWRSRYRLYKKQRGRLYLRLVKLLVRAGIARERARLAAQLRAGALSEAAYRGQAEALAAVLAL
ncbi:MAG: glycosyltransferase family 2 protein [Anaerolineae bacterium]